MATVTARGYAVVSVQPDSVELSFDLSARESAPHAALADVARRSETLSALLDEMEIPSDARTTAGVSVYEEQLYQEGRELPGGYRASNRVSVRIADAATLAPLMREAVERAGAQVQGPTWRVAPDNPARLEACERAASDARASAGAYAESLGMRVGDVQEIADPSTAGFYRVLSGGYVPTVAASHVDVESGGLEVSAAVDVTFGLEPAPAGDA